MKIRSIAELQEEYKDIGGIEDFNVERNKILHNYPFSTVVTADYKEIENAEKWCKENTDGSVNLWYGKTDYDFGYIEFFYKNQNDKLKFENIVEEMITKYPSGMSGKTKEGSSIVEVDSK